MQGTVTTNWYAIRATATGELLAVGWWMPAPIEGLTIERVSAPEARRLMDELKVKAAR